MEKSKAAGFRMASRLIGYLGVLACAVAGAVWYIYTVFVSKTELAFLQIAEKNVFPKGMIPQIVAVTAAAFVVIAIVLRIVSAVIGAKETAFLRAQEAEEDDADEGAYLEESLDPIGDAALPAPTPTPAIAAPAEEAVSVSDSPIAFPKHIFAPLEMRVPIVPLKKIKKTEKKAPRQKKPSKIKVAIGKKVEQIVPSEKRAKFQKKVNTVKRTAKVVIPVAVACVAVATVVKKREERKREKQKARNRRLFYEWLG